METWIVIYGHRHGIDVLLVKAAKEPTIEQIQKTFPEINWELDRNDEYLDVMGFIDPSEIRTLEL